MAKKPSAAESIASESAPKRPWFKKKRFIIPIAVVLLIIIASPKGNGSSQEATVAEPETQATSETVTETASAAPTPTSAPTPEVSSEFKSALRQAKSYSDTLHLCQAALFSQLTSEYGGQFSPEAAQYAIDNVQADWNANALAQAISYQETLALSPADIHDQLTSEYGGQCTTENADFAVANLP